MPAKPSVYYRPNNLQETLSLLSQPDAKPLGGGTKLIAGGFSGAVVDLQDVGLDKLELQAESLLVGAMVRLADLSDFLASSSSMDVSGEVVSAPRMLMDSIRRAGPNTYRNQATIGGEIASRLPDSEFTAALMVLEARVVFSDKSIMDTVSYMAAYDPPDGLIIEASIPWLAGRGASERVARTPADYPIVSVTAFLPEQDDLRIAATGIDQRAVRLSGAEEIVNSGGSIEDAALAAKSRSRHPGDFRGDASYRAEMAFVLTRRVLRQILPN